ncbi:hypothetical protein [Streptomyces profundus]|uniref:hypothetical protein n=1 Tax=Streptomyces profundus TaxID=2867410 RepID=UPI001D161347|nr:hypothetical protein [Streptomyces sp. MA3_2.13]UED87405.1 hypothetical protein K4G22_26975 [Streptomyces sp. MA3_2.13]
MTSLPNVKALPNVPWARLLGLMAVAVLFAALLGPAPAARAIDHSKGQPGFCENGTGVTVVIDFQELGGTTIVRCYPSGTRGTGLDALKGAGFQIAGVQRWGESFVCRIENRPSAVEEIPIEDNEGYREACVDTPPASAYWSYWHAGNNCAWQYSQWGVKNRDFVPGGFEGWSFSLNATADSNPTPRIAPVRPGTEGGECDAPDEPGPITNDPDERQPGSQAPGVGQGPDGTDGGTSGGDGDNGGNGGGTPGNGNETGNGGGDGGEAGDQDESADEEGADGEDGALPPPVPRPSADPSTPPDPEQNVTFTGGEEASDVNDVIREQSGASSAAPWVAGGALLLLVAASWLTARRRRRVREA